MEHLPLGGDACEQCEMQYALRRSEIARNGWFVLGFVLPWLFVMAIHDYLPSWSARSGGVRAITTGVPMLDVLIMTGVTAVFMGKAMIGLRLWWDRRVWFGGRGGVARGAVAPLPRATVRTR